MCKKQANIFFLFKWLCCYRLFEILNSLRIFHAMETAEMFFTPQIPVTFWSSLDLFISQMNMSFFILDIAINNIYLFLSQNNFLLDKHNTSITGFRAVQFVLHSQT